MNRELPAVQQGECSSGARDFVTGHRWTMPAQRLRSNPNLNFKEGESPDSA